jgi:hypothetical protein
LVPAPPSSSDWRPEFREANSSRLGGICDAEPDNEPAVLAGEWDPPNDSAPCLAWREANLSRLGACDGGSCCCAAASAANLSRLAGGGWDDIVGSTAPEISFLISILDHCDIRA